MKTKQLMRGAAFAAISALTAGAQTLQQWDFETGLDATAGGQALQYMDAATQAGASFGTTTSFGIPGIGGAEAKVMKFGAFVAPSGFTIPLIAPPNEGGSLVNSWTAVMDLFYPDTSDRKWRALLEIDGGLTGDSDLFINTANGLGIDGTYQGNVTANEWHRIALVIDGVANTIRKYIDGVFVGSQAGGGLDGRWSLAANGGSAGLFTDNDGDVAPGYVNSIQLRDSALTTGQILALGGPKVAGIPATIPPIPAHIESSTPDRRSDRRGADAADRGESELGRFGHPSGFGQAAV